MEHLWVHNTITEAWLEAGAKTDFKTREIILFYAYIQYTRHNTRPCRTIKSSFTLKNFLFSSFYILSVEPIFIVTHYMKWVKTSWTYIDTINSSVT